MKTIRITHHTRHVAIKYKIFWMKHFFVMHDVPFTDKGNIVDLFADDIDIWTGIRGVIERINANASAA